MGLRIRTNTASIGARTRLEETSNKVAGNMERLASGFRINKAADDAAGLGISEGLRAKIRSMGQAKRNASDGVSMIQVAEGSMNEISNILIRLRELSTQAASDTIGNKERAFANKEYVELVEEIDRIGNITEFNGIKLLKGGNDEGSMTNLSIHVDVGDGSQPNRDTIELDLSKMVVGAKDAFGLDVGSAIGPVESGEDFQRETAAQKLTVIDQALHKVNSMRADLGAKQSRLQSTISNLSVAHENASATHSRIKDVDFAEETASFTQNRILQQGGISILSQANSMPELAMNLLR
jgi:flagellin